MSLSLSLSLTQICITAAAHIKFPNTQQETRYTPRKPRNPLKRKKMTTLLKQTDLPAADKAALTQDIRTMAKIQSKLQTSIHRNILQQSWQNCSRIRTQAHNHAYGNTSNLESKHQEKHKHEDFPPSWKTK